MAKLSPILLPKNVIDETGHRYGRLLVREYVEVPGEKAHWRCDCDCGNEFVTRGDRLRTERTVSCGCWRADKDVRQAARLKVSPRRRKQIADMGGEARRRSR